MGTKIKRLKLFLIIMSILFALALSGFVILFIHGNYCSKIMVKLGISDRSYETNWAVEGWNNTMEQLDYDADIVFFGDSITYGSDFRQFFPNRNIVNLGYSGDTTVGMINRVSAIQAVSPEKVFVLGGINGLTNSNINNCLSSYSKLLEELEKNIPNGEIYIQSILPISSSKELKVCSNSTIDKFNLELKKIAKKHGMSFIDLYSFFESNGEMNPTLTKDGIHLNSEGYKLWAEILTEYID